MSSCSSPTRSIFGNMQENSFIMLEDSQDFVVSSPRAKKRRLDHLSWEEKLQRKKLKNRVAAQTSRDRKKAKMEQMESTLSELMAQNEKILAECDALKNLNNKLTQENATLQKQLQEPCKTCSQNRSVECGVQGSTASDLLQKGLDGHSAAALTPRSIMALWRIVLACLLYRTSSTKSTMTSTWQPGSHSHSLSFRISPETLKLLLKNQIIKKQRDTDKVILRKWWGRHQKTWNPVELQAV